MKFEFSNPTKIIFGAGSLARLGDAALRHGSRALLVTGGGSVKRSGTFDRAVKSLTDAGLAVINPSWMRFAARSNPRKFVQFAERIFGLRAGSPDDLDCALAGIDRFEAFLGSIGCPTRFSDLGIDGSKFELYATETLRIVNDGRGRLPALPAMTKDDIVMVLRSAA